MMSDKVTEYLQVYKDVLLRYEDEEEWYRRLDELYHSMENHEIDSLEGEIESLRPSAPQSLGLVDVPVKIGESRIPRVER